MKRILHLSFIILLSSCLSEKDADIGKPSTFVRYINGGNNDRAQVAEETLDKDGIIILGTTKIISPTEQLKDSVKIKLVKTDNYGNTLFQKVYPETFNSTQNWRGQSLLQLTTGSLIVIGDNIQANRTDMLLLIVDKELNTTTSKTIDFSAFDVPKNQDGTTKDIQGKAIQLNAKGNYLVLGAVQDINNNMILAELDKSDLHIIWVRKYGAGTSDLTNKMYLDGANNVFWSGTVTRNSADIRLVKTSQNSLSTIFDLPIGSPVYQETGNDICRYGYGFAVIGSTNETTAGDQDILFKILAEDGSVLLSKSIAASADTDIGNSISSVRGGIVILGTTKIEGKDDYYLMKYDAFGNNMWAEARVFGSKDKDRGASVRQLSDGSLLILGTTEFGGVEAMMLMKADSEGNIE